VAAGVVCPPATPWLALAVGTLYLRECQSQRRESAA